MAEAPAPSRPDQGHDLILGALALRPDGAGVSTYIRELVARLPQHTRARLAALVATTARGELPASVTPLLRPPAHGVRRAIQALRDLGPARVVHGLDVDVPLRGIAARISTVHDLAVFDVPWAFPRRRVVGERVIVAAALRRADHLIAVSDFTAERIRTLFHRDATVIPEAPPSSLRPASGQEIVAIRRRYDLPSRFVLAVGTLEPRKNVAALADACRDLTVPLVVAGGAGWKTSPPVNAQLLGFVPPRDLPALYGAATVSAYVTTYEGFGLPPLEALACGCAVVSAPVPSMRLARLPVLATPTNDVKGIAAALRGLLEDPDARADIVARGQVALATFSWANTASETAKIYESFGLPRRTPSPPSDESAVG